MKKTLFLLFPIVFSVGIIFCAPQYLDAMGFGETMDSYLDIEKIEKTKYSSSHYEEIKEALESKEEKIRFLTFNMLFDLRDDRYPSEYKWDSRKHRVISLIEEIDPDIIGIQELLTHQRNFIIEKLSDTYLYTGEMNGIFLKKDRFLVVESNSYPLPEKFDKFNVATIALIKDLLTDKEITLVNAHLPYDEADYRESSVIYLMEKIKNVETPIVFNGDFNTFPSLLKYKDLPYYDGTRLQKIIRKYGLEDSIQENLIGHLGPIASFSNKDQNYFYEEVSPFTGTGTPGIILDHIYVSKHIQVLLDAIVPKKIDGYFPSDHFPVVADLLVE